MVATRTGRESKAASAGGSVSSNEEHSQQHEQQQQQQQGSNLGSLLTHYEHANNNNNNINHAQNQSSSSLEQQQPQQVASSSSPVSLTIDIPSGVHHGGADGVKEEEEEEEEEYRDRSLTMGSEFDQIFAHVGKDGRGMSISGLLTPLGDAMSEGTSSTAISGSTSSTYNSAGMHHSPQGVAAATAFQSHLPRLPEHASSSSSAAGGIMAMDTTPIISNYTATVIPSRAIPVGGGGGGTSRGRGESHGSATMFLNGIYNTTNQQQQQHQRQKQQQQPISHTPPSNLGTSYENSHFGKRMRAGVSLLRECVYLIFSVIHIHVVFLTEFM